LLLLLVTGSLGGDALDVACRLRRLTSRSDSAPVAARVALLDTN